MPDADGTEVQYWDSPVFISFLSESQPDRVKVFEELSRELRATRRRSRILESNFLLSEVHPSKGLSQAYKDIIDEIFQTDRRYIQFMAVSRQVALRARQLAVDFPNLTNPDAIHLATALLGKADVFFTYDGDRDNKLRRSGGLLRFDGEIEYAPGQGYLKICEPRISYGPLFDEIQRQS